MDKQTIERDMKKFVGGGSFITATKLARFLHKRDTFAYSLLNGLDKVPGITRGTKYYIPDVAQRIMEVRRQ